MYLYVLLKNNVVTKEKVHEDDRKAAKTPLLIYYAPLDDCMLQIYLFQNELQRRVTHFGLVEQVIL